MNAKRSRLVFLWQGTALFGVAVAAAALSRAEDWSRPELLATLAILTVGSHMFPMPARTIHVSGAFMGLVLAMALLGPVPAAALGVTAVLVDALWTRPAPWHLVNDLVTYATFPLVGGVLIEVATGPADVREEVAFAAVVGGVFLVTNLLNFVLIVGQKALHRGSDGPLADLVRSTWVPVLPWELAAAFVTAVVAFGYETLGVRAVGLLVLMLFVFQLLLRAVLRAEAWGEELQARIGQLALMHEGMLTVMVQTLSLRDRMTARHSAAVARYAKEMAAAAGLGEREQELVHTAALLHDIGKFTFPDSILKTDAPLGEAELAIIRRHPVDGARIVRKVKGYEEVAEIVLAHHERVDGQGYPYALRDAEIPILSRMIAVADTYDSMTSRDSYRRPVSHELAVAELRRVAGTQLDGNFVELFVEIVERDGVGFGHATDADMEAELRAERRPAPLGSARPAAP
jgi:putative nucleotidyltransferase with HDIG domain